MTHLTSVKPSTINGHDNQQLGGTWALGVDGGGSGDWQCRAMESLRKAGRGIARAFHSDSYGPRGMEHDQSRRAAVRAWRSEIESMHRKNANDCVSLAERGIFVEIGLKCGFCLHVLPDGDCRLGLLASQAAAE